MYGNVLRSAMIILRPLVYESRSRGYCQARRRTVVDTGRLLVLHSRLTASKALHEPARSQGPMNIARKVF